MKNCRKRFKNSFSKRSFLEMKTQCVQIATVRLPDGPLFPLGYSSVCDAQVTFSPSFLEFSPGPHRMLGPIYTKVKSVKLDIWNRSWADTMEKVGNKIANEYFEYKMPTSYRKPNVNSSMQDLERFVHDKYVKRLFSPPEFVDPVTEYLDAKKNGTELNPTKFLSCFSHNFFVQQQGDSFPRPCAFNTERCTKDPNCPSAKVGGTFKNSNSIKPS